MTKLEELKLNETKEVSISIYGPGVVIIENMYFHCMGLEDLEMEDENANELDVYYVTECYEEEPMVFRLEEAEANEDYFDPFKAILRRVK